MVFSRLNKAVQYSELKSIDKDDIEKEAILYEIIIENEEMKHIEIIVAVGNMKDNYKEQGVIYFPLYLVKKNKKVVQIGLYEIETREQSKYVDKRGNFKLEKWETKYRDPLLYSFVTRDMLMELRLKPEAHTDFDEEKDVEKDVEKDIEKDVEKDILDIPEIRRDIFTKAAHMVVPSSLKQETKMDAKRERDEYKSVSKDVSKNATWIQQYMENNQYYIVDNEGGGDCLFATVRDAFAQIGHQTTILQLREKIAKEVDDKMYFNYKEIYDNASQSIIEDTKILKELQKQHISLKTKFENTLGRDEKRDLIDAAKKVTNEMQHKTEEKKISQEIVSEFAFMKKVKSKEDLQKMMTTCEFWGDTWSISTLERILNIKFILLSQEAYRNKDLRNVLACGQLNDLVLESKGIFEPEYYIIVEYSGYHYKLIGYKTKQIFTFREIPFDIKKMIVEKCLEKNAGPFYIIPDFLVLKEEMNKNGSEEEPKFEELSESKILDLYDDDVVFLFYSKSNDKPLPGKGAGEKVPESELRDYSELANIPSWRKKLSNFWVDPFTLDNHRWSSVEHYYQASKFKENNPEFYLSFSLDSGTELSKDTVMAKAAGGKTGKFKGTLLRPKEVTMDPHFFPKRSEQEMYQAQKAKFNQNEELKRLLLATKRAKLMHHQRGSEPVLFETLMKVRHELRPPPSIL